MRTGSTTSTDGHGQRFPGSLRRDLGDPDPEQGELGDGQTARERGQVAAAPCQDGQERGVLAHVARRGEVLGLRDRRGESPAGVPTEPGKQWRV
jgi:hypothetical protein